MTIDLSWDEQLGIWRGLADPDVRDDPRSATAGPAGVWTFRAGDAGVAFCSLTGRVAELWTGPDPGLSERSLLLILTGQDGDGAFNEPESAVGEAVTLPIAPIDDHLDLITAAGLQTDLRLELVDDQAVPDFLLHAEYAAVLQALSGAHPDLLAVAEVEAALDSAVERARALPSSPLEPVTNPLQAERLAEATRRFRPWLEQQSAAVIVSRAVGQLEKAARQHATGLPRPRTRKSAVAVAEPPSHLLDTEIPVRPSLRPVGENERSTPGEQRRHVATIPVRDAAFTLTDIRARRAGSGRGSISDQDSAGWHRVEVDAVFDPLAEAIPWLICFAPESAGSDELVPVGGGPLRAGDPATSGLVPTEAPIAEVRVDLRPYPRRPWLKVEAAEHEARVAEYARRTGGEDISGGSYAASCRHWLELGDVRRAGWAYYRGNRRAVDAGLGLGAEGDIDRAILRAGSRGATLLEPTTHVPAWACVADFTSMAGRFG